MYNKSPKKILPWVALVAGFAGMALQTHLFSLTNERGLFPRYHFAGIGSFVLLAAVLAWAFLSARKIPATELDAPKFPGSVLSAAGILVWAVCIVLSSLQFRGDTLQILTLIFAIVSAGAMAMAAVRRFQGLQPHVLFYGAVIVFLILRTLYYSRLWIRETQIQAFIFPLLAHLLLMVTCYYRAAAALDNAECRKYVVASRITLFCCLLAVPAGDWLFYLSAGLWLATDFCVLPVPAEDGNTEEIPEDGEETESIL
ncbi:MAG: hypothetical protein IKK11_02380 [Oscillospiraceae bacterium]|nr:hypothetical protein [Oscillospiraceae bacterium]